ncbi:hypothetical protein BDZ91DRAFT_727997, partial [Kalaharituber pfeilii]
MLTSDKKIKGTKNHRINKGIFFHVKNPTNLPHTQMTGNQCIISYRTVRERERRRKQEHVDLKRKIKKIECIIRTKYEQEKHQEGNREIKKTKKTINRTVALLKSFLFFYFFLFFFFSFLFLLFLCCRENIKPAVGCKQRAKFTRVVFRKGTA